MVEVQEVLGLGAVGMDSVQALLKDPNVQKLISSITTAAKNLEPTVSALLSNAQHTNQSDLGSVLSSFMEQQEALESNSSYLGQVKDALKAALDIGNENSSDSSDSSDSGVDDVYRSEGVSSEVSSSITSNKSESCISRDGIGSYSFYSSCSSVYECAVADDSLDETNSNDVARINSVGQLYAAGGQGIIQPLLDNLLEIDETKEAFLQYIKGSIKILQGYEAKHSKIAIIISQLSDTIVRGKEAAEESREAAISISRNIAQIKSAVDETNRSIGYVCNSLVSLIKTSEGESHELNNLIQLLDAVILYNIVKDEISKCSQQTAKHESILSQLDQNKKKIIEDIIKAKDRQNDAMDLLIPAITLHMLICEKSLVLLSQEENRQSIKECFQQATVAVVAKHLGEARGLLVNLHKQNYPSLKESTESVVASVQQTASLAKKVFPDGSKVTYFICLGSGHVVSVVAATILYYKAKHDALVNVSLNQPLNIVVASCFAFSVLCLFVAARSGTKVTESREKSDVFRIFYCILPLFMVAGSTMVFASRFIPSIASDELIFSNWPLESIMIGASIGCLFLVLLCAIVVTGILAIYNSANTEVTIEECVVPQVEGASIN